MAIKPTIYKFSIQLSDMNRAHYDNVNLTVALHPSETAVRMMVRVLSYCLNAIPNLEFTKGVSAVDEPDLWAVEMDETISLWIDVGEPSIERIKRGSHRSKQMKIYSFNTKSSIWWSQVGRETEALGVEAYLFDFEEIEQLTDLVERTNQVGVTISEQNIGVALNDGYCEVNWQALTT